MMLFFFCPSPFIKLSMLISLCILSLKGVLPMDFFQASFIKSSCYSETFKGRQQHLLQTLLPGAEACASARPLSTSEMVGSRGVERWCVYSPGMSCHGSLVALDSSLRIRATDLMPSHHPLMEHFKAVLCDLIAYTDYLHSFYWLLYTVRKQWMQS